MILLCFLLQKFRLWKKKPGIELFFSFFLPFYYALVILRFNREMLVIGDMSATVGFLDLMSIDQAYLREFRFVVECVAVGNLFLNNTRSRHSCLDHFWTWSQWFGLIPLWLCHWFGSDNFWTGGKWLGLDHFLIVSNSDKSFTNRILSITRFWKIRIRPSLNMSVIRIR